MRVRHVCTWAFFYDPYIVCIYISDDDSISVRVCVHDPDRCMEPPFDKLGDGVVSTISGYCGGSEANPTYRQVSAGKTGHTESIQVSPCHVSVARCVWQLIECARCTITVQHVSRQYAAAAASQTPPIGRCRLAKQGTPSLYRRAHQ
jgi:Peptide methionine sulfoxide reductase